MVALRDSPVTIELAPLRARWLVFMHTSDMRQVEPGPGRFFSPMRGQGQLAEHAADYVLLYQDGAEERIAIRRRFQVGAFTRRWGENCFEAVAQHKPYPVRPHHEQSSPYWGTAQMRGFAGDEEPWVSWLWAWENPHPEKTLTGVRFEPRSGVLVVPGLSAGDVASLPLR